jgi:hypothetical protein
VLKASSWPMLAAALFAWSRETIYHILNVRKLSSLAIANLSSLDINLHINETFLGNHCRFWTKPFMFTRRGRLLKSPSSDENWSSDENRNWRGPPVIVLCYSCFSECIDLLFISHFCKEICAVLIFFFFLTFQKLSIYISITNV